MNKIGGQNFSIVEKHFRKMVRKIFLLTLDRSTNSAANNPAQGLGYGVSYNKSSRYANSKTA